ncbi:MAG: hypothetical protein OHK0029_07800 [Armatimonadaceae bacterium]
MDRLYDTLNTACCWGGVLEGAIVDSETGVILLQKGKGDITLSVAAKTMAQAVRIKLRETSARLRDQLRDEPDSLEEMCAAFQSQYHLVHLLPFTCNLVQYPLFLYLVCDREKTNLAKIRIQLAKLLGSLDAPTDIPIPNETLIRVAAGVREPCPKVAFPETVSEVEDESLPPFMRDEVVRMLLDARDSITQ